VTITAIAAILILVGLEATARVLSQNWIATQVRSYSGASSVRVQIRAFPYLPPLVTSGSISKLQVTADQVPAGATVLSRVSIEGSQVRIDRHSLAIHHQVRVTSIARARVTVEITAAELSAGIGYPLTVTAGNKLTAEVKGITVPANLSVTDGHMISVTVAGMSLGALDLSTSQLVPRCGLTGDTGAQVITFGCSIAPVPASLLESLSSSS